MEDSPSDTSEEPSHRTSCTSSSSATGHPSERNRQYNLPPPPSSSYQSFLSSLQLPRMPPTACCPSSSSCALSTSSSTSRATAASSTLPTITLLVVADVDLRSASQLSEYALQNRIDADLCVACGPFCRDDDLAPYRRGGGSISSGSCASTSERRRRTAAEAATKLLLSEAGGEQEKDSFVDSLVMMSSASPLFRTREHTSALEGILTATLSQLENIVCRVVYCPGSTDPITVGYCWNHHPKPLSATSPSAAPSQPPPPSRPSASLAWPRRLTPNSRNVNRQWLPIAPGLGAAALLHLDFGGGGGAEQPDHERRQPCDAEVDDAQGPLAGSSTPAPASSFCVNDLISSDDYDVDDHDDDNDSHNDDDDDDDHDISDAEENDDDQANDLEDEGDDGEDDNEDDDEEEDAGEEEEAALWVEQVQHLRQQSKGYRSLLERLLSLPPPVQHPVRFAQPSQTILVTHYVNCKARRASQVGSNNDPHMEASDIESDARGAGTDGVTAAEPAVPALPWPPEHEGFRRCALAQERLCLEIASGNPGLEPRVFAAWGERCNGSGSDANREDSNVSTTVLLPGSLRLRGEFSVVQVSLQEQGETPEGGESPPVHSDQRLKTGNDAAAAVAATAPEAPIGAGGNSASRAPKTAWNRSSSLTSASPLFKATPASSVASARSRSGSPSRDASVAATASGTVATPTNSKRTFSWVVQNVDFHKLSDRKG